MYCRLCILALAVALAMPGPVTAQEPSIAAQLEAVRAKYGLPALAAAVVRDGQIIAKDAVGTRVLGIKTSVTIDDRFHLGSDTKAMTATLAGMMVEGGKLSWTSTIGEVLGPVMPALNAKFAAITLVIAGAMIEKVSEETWEHLITTRIFEPLGLKTAGLGPQATFGRFDAPVGHRVDDDGTVTPMPWGSSRGCPAGHGASRHRAHVDRRFRDLGRLERGRRTARPGAGESGDATASAPGARQNAGDREPEARHTENGRVRARLGYRQDGLDAAADPHAQRIELAKPRDDLRRHR
jgi:CubicO group peptidase (beta-lactamase class C family)